jgi:hypothetical protein
LREIERDCHPDYPKGYDPNLSQYYYRGRRRYYYYPGYTNLENSVADPNMMSSLLEQKIKERMAVVGNPLPSRSYVAVVAWAPDSPLGVDRVREEGSLHVVFGRW